MYLALTCINLIISTELTARQKVRPHRWDLYSEIIKTVERPVDYIGGYKDSGDKRNI